VRERLRDPRVVDTLIAIAMFALAATSTISIGDGSAFEDLYRERDWLAYLLIAGQTLPLIIRRSQPKLMTILIGLAWGIDRLFEYAPGAAGFALLIAFHAVGAYLPPKQSARFGWSAVVAVLGWTIVGVVFSDPVPVEAVYSMGLVVALPLIIGREVYQRRRHVVELEERAELAEQEKQAEARRAVAEERGRIARELHDVVAHQMTVMALQAEGARRMSKDLDPRVEEALGVISDAGRSALDEMQRMVALLRSEPGDDLLAPQPTLAEIPALVGQIVDAGLPVEIEVVGDVHPLGPGLELTAYRVIQESLTFTEVRRTWRNSQRTDDLRSRISQCHRYRRWTWGRGTGQGSRARAHWHARAGHDPRRQPHRWAATRGRLSGVGSPPGARMIRVMLVDDQAMIRSGLQMILEAEPDLQVIAEADSGQEAIRIAGRDKPDVILMDIRMPGMDGLTATQEILEANPSARIIILTTFDVDDYVYRSLRIGASGFLLKNAPADDLVHAVRVVAGGEAMLAPAVTKRVIEEFGRQPEPSPAVTSMANLTDRELEVLQLVAAGMSNAEIGEALFVSETTVKTHVSRMLTKLGLRDRVQAVVAAYDAGLVRPNS